MHFKSFFPLFLSRSVLLGLVPAISLCWLSAQPASGAPQSTSTPDFTGTIDPQVLTVRAGAVGVYNLSVIPLNGFNSDVQLSVTGLPGFNGASTDPMFEFSPLSGTITGGSGQGSLAVFTSSKTVPGTYNVFITGTSASPAITHTAEVKMVVLPFGPDFTGSLSNSTAFVKSGQSTTYGITVIPIDGFTGDVELNVEELPYGAHFTFSPKVITGGSGSSTLTVSTQFHTPTGRFYPLLIGQSGGLKHTTTLILDVNAPSDFTGSVTPTNPVVERGSSVTLTGTVVPLAGFTGLVEIRNSTLPRGVHVSIAPNTITGGSGIYMVTVSIDEDAVPGDYPVTFTGFHGTIAHGTTITLTVNGAPAGPPPPSSGNYLWESNDGPDVFISTVDSIGNLGAPVIAGGPASNSNGNIPSFATNPSKSFLFALDTSSTLIRVFSIIGPGVQLTEIKQSPFFPSASSGPLNSLSSDPSARFLYVVESPATIEQFNVNGVTGVLTHGSAVTETADLRETVVDPTGKYLFANDLTGGRVFAYGIGVSGSLSAVSGSPFTVPANGQPTQVVIDSTGKLLYTPLLGGGVAAFSIDSTSCKLANVMGSPFATTNLPSSIAVAPMQGFLYVSNAEGSIDGFKIDENSGALSPVVGSPFGTAPSPSNLKVDSSGEFLFVSNFPNSTVFGFRIDSTTGSLSPLEGSPFPAATNPTLLTSLKIP